MLIQSLYMLYFVFQSTNAGSLTGDLYRTSLGQEQTELVSVSSDLFGVKTRRYTSEQGAA